MGQVIDLAAFRQKKQQDGNTVVPEPQTKEFDFDAVVRKNKENAERLRAYRNSANTNTKDSYRIK